MKTKDIFPEREEYTLVNPDFAEQVLSRLNQCNNPHMRFRFVKKITNEVYCKPIDEDFAFGTGHGKSSNGKYRRLGNVTITFGTINHTGTLYIAENGAWQLVEHNGMSCASGSGSKSYLPKPLDTSLPMIVKQHTRIERFESIT